MAATTIHAFITHRKNTHAYSQMADLLDLRKTLGLRRTKSIPQTTNAMNRAVKVSGGLWKKFGHAGSSEFYLQ